MLTNHFILLDSLTIPVLVLMDVMFPLVTILMFTQVIYVGVKLLKGLTGSPAALLEGNSVDIAIANVQTQQTTYSFFAMPNASINYSQRKHGSFSRNKS